MHTALAPYRLNEIIHTQEKSLGGSVVFWLRLLRYRSVSWVLRSVVKKELHSIAQEYLEMALIFKGIHANLIVTPGSVDQDAGVIAATDDLIHTLESSETKLMTMRGRFLDLASKPTIARSQTLRDQLSEVITANADAFEAFQAVRWELMEQQADADIKAGRTNTFENADDAIAFLTRQS